MEVIVRTLPGRVNALRCLRFAGDGKSICTIDSMYTLACFETKSQGLQFEVSLRSLFQFEPLSIAAYPYPGGERFAIAYISPREEDGFLVEDFTIAVFSPGMQPEIVYSTPCFGSPVFLSCTNAGQLVAATGRIVLLFDDTFSIQKHMSITPDYLTVYGLGVNQTHEEIVITTGYQGGCGLALLSPNFAGSTMRSTAILPYETISNIAISSDGNRYASVLSQGSVYVSNEDRHVCIGKIVEVDQHLEVISLHPILGDVEADCISVQNATEISSDGLRLARATTSARASLRHPIPGPLFSPGENDVVLVGMPSGSIYEYNLSTRRAKYREVFSLPIHSMDSNVNVPSVAIADTNGNVAIIDY